MPTGWKLAATLSGWGSDGLLASYDAERRPIGTRNVNKAAELYSEEQKHGNGIAMIEEDSTDFGGLSHAPLEFLPGSSAETVDQSDEDDDGRGCNGDPRDSRGGHKHAPFLSRRVRGKT